MLFMMIVKASKKAEAAKKPNLKLQKQMDDYNEALLKAGIRVMAKGLHPDKEGMRLSFLTPGKPPRLTHGPFKNTHELIAGFFIIEVASKQEAVDWFLKVPDPQGFGEGQVELREIY